MSQVTLPRLWTEAEASEYLGVTELTLYRWRKAGVISCHMVGKSPRYSEQHILEYLAAREVQASPRPEPKPKNSRHGLKHQERGPSDLARAYQILSDAKARDDGHR